MQFPVNEICRKHFLAYIMEHFVALMFKLVFVCCVFVDQLCVCLFLSFLVGLLMFFVYKVVIDAWLFLFCIAPASISGLILQQICCLLII